MLVILCHKDTGKETRRVPIGVPIRLESYERVKGTDAPIIVRDIDRSIFKLCHNKSCGQFGIYRFK